MELRRTNNAAVISPWPPLYGTRQVAGGQLESSNNCCFGYNYNPSSSQPHTVRYVIIPVTPAATTGAVAGGNVEGGFAVYDWDVVGLRASRRPAGNWLLLPKESDFLGQGGRFPLLAGTHQPPQAIDPNQSSPTHPPREHP